MEEVPGGLVEALPQARVAVELTAGGPCAVTRDAAPVPVGGNTLPRVIEHLVATVECMTGSGTGIEPTGGTFVR